MRKKRKKRRQTTKKQSISYTFDKLEIISFIPLNDMQLADISGRIEKVMKVYRKEPIYIVSKKIFLEMKQSICSVTFCKKTDCFIVTINEEYLN